MDEAFRIMEYLPLSFKTQSEQEYIQFLWETFDLNYNNQKYQFAFLAYHMLTMSFIYFNIWQIKKIEPSDFQKAMIGFSKDHERQLLNATSPFTFWLINESTVMRFFKLIGCDNEKVGNYARLVKDRNDTAHTNGNIYYSTQEALNRKIAEILRVVAEIETHSQSIIEKCYHKFLIESHDPDEREYVDETDQIREILIHNHYLSPKDLEICHNFALTTLANHAEIENIRILHETVRAFTLT